MRLNLKPAAAAAAAAALLLLILDLTWPGHGAWLLIVGILLALSAAGLWFRERMALGGNAYSNQPQSPFSAVGAYGMSGARVQALRQEPAGVPLAAVLAPVAALSILLFIGGAIGSSEPEPVEAVVAIQEEVSAIDRSADSALPTPEVQPPTAHQTPPTQTAVTVTAVTSNSGAPATDAAEDSASPSSEPIRPIVVEAPQPASAADEEPQVAEVDPRALTAIEYTVEEGDTLYEIAVRYDSTVEAIMDLNKLDAYSFIHPGDVLLIPEVEQEDEES